MAGPPWQVLREPSGECLVFATYFHVKSPWQVLGVFSRTGQIRRQLAEAEGLLGYSMRARPLSLEFWTLSAWENQRSLLEFTRQAPHARVMAELRPKMRRFDSRRWKANPSDVPPDWDAALRRLSEAG